MKEFILSSGAKLCVDADSTPFEDSLALFESILEEGKTVNLNAKADGMDMMKSLFCTLLPSKRVKACLEKCMERVTYNGLRVSKQTWEPRSARADYLEACILVAEENITPFGKSLFAQFAAIALKLEKLPA